MLTWPDLMLPPINLWSVWKREQRKCSYQCNQCERSRCAHALAKEEQSEHKTGYLRYGS